jgi:hypothetical protein
MNIRRITKTIREFKPDENQEELKAAVMELLEVLETVHRYGRMTVIYNNGCLVKIEMETSEKE